MLELNTFPGTFKFAFKLIDDEILLLFLTITGVIFVLIFWISIGNTKKIKDIYKLKNKNVFYIHTWH